MGFGVRSTSLLWLCCVRDAHQPSLGETEEEVGVEFLRPPEAASAADLLSRTGLRPGGLDPDVRGGGGRPSDEG